MKKEKNSMEYSKIICGGTFDHLHAGHKAFLKFAFQKGQEVIVGLTSDAYVAKFKKGNGVQRFVDRKKALENFLQNEGILPRAKIVAIDNKFDQTQIPEDLSIALVVSRETYPVGLEINKKRTEKGLNALPILTAPLVNTESGEKISSRAIREGSMDREGIMLPDPDFLSHTLVIPKTLRELLHKPFGQLLPDKIPASFLIKANRIVAVGDATTKRLHNMGVRPIVSVVDFQIERQKVYDNLSEIGFTGNETVVMIKNPPGELKPAVWNKLLETIQQFATHKESVVIVDGEEDLLVIPLILTLPLGFLLFYGQPARHASQGNAGGPAIEEGESKEGVVVLPITEELKHQTFTILKQFVPQ